MDQPKAREKVIGILALQGDFDAHRRVLEDRLHVPTRQVRSSRDLSLVDALILPGGESTTIAKLLDRAHLDVPIRERALAGMPVYGTCAGMILMAKEIEQRSEQPTLDLIDMTVARNAFGRQVDSFEAELPFGQGSETETVRGVFIRAPYVTRIGPQVEVVAVLEDKIVAVRQGSLLATAFHPELTDSDSVHALFVRIVEESQE